VTGFCSSLLPLLLAEWLVFEGISVDEQGRQHYLDATVAYKRAVLNAIHYLAKFGYTPEQVNRAIALQGCCNSKQKPEMYVSQSWYQLVLLIP
jgi:hypothetical protein